MAKADRLFYLINLIKSNQGLTSKELAEKCRVSERTIFRDINSLASASLPIYCKHGYKFLEGTFLPTLNLTDEEFSTLQFAFEYSPIKADRALQESANNLLSKLQTARKSLPREELTIERSSPTSGRGVLDRQDTSPKTKPDLTKAAYETSKFSLMVKLLALAIDQQKAIRIKTKRRGEQLEEFLIEPYALLSKNGGWLVLCYCWHCKQIALYDLSKIRSVSLTTQSFKSKLSLDKLIAVHQ